MLRLFILEAGMQGLAGSVAGSLAGAALALAGGVIRYGTTAVSQAAAGDVAASIGLSMAIGIGLSLLGVSYPALVAARMQPVEAMRVGCRPTARPTKSPAKSPAVAVTTLAADVASVHSDCLRCGVSAS